MAGFLLLFTLLIISILPKYITLLVTLQPGLGKMLLSSIPYSFPSYKPVHPNIIFTAIIPSVNTC